MRQRPTMGGDGPALQWDAGRRISGRDQDLRDRISQRPPSVGELAWLLLELLRAGEHARSLGWCLGALRPSNLAVQQGALVRVRSPRSAVRALATLRAHQHRHAGHDPWCTVFGISRIHLIRFLRSVNAPDGSGLLLEVIDAAWEEQCHVEGHANETPRERCDFGIREVITPEPWCTQNTRGARRSEQSSQRLWR